MSSAPSRSNTDEVGDALRRAHDELRRAIAVMSDGPAAVLIDGRSGAGKSTLAAWLAHDWPGGLSPQLIALDSLYPGWDGMDAGVEDARRQILVPHAAGRVSAWRRWDWALDRYGQEEAVDPTRPVIIEGAGLLTARTAPLGTVRAWLEAPEESRRHRALERDGETYRPHWHRWALQEQRHIARDAPLLLATHVFEVP